MRYNCRLLVLCDARGVQEVWTVLNCAHRCPRISAVFKGNVL